MDFQTLINLSIIDEYFSIFEKELKGKAVKRENNVGVEGERTHDFELLYKEDGILLTVLNEQIIGVKVYFSPTPIAQPFQGEFVFGLSHISSENEIKKQFDFPQNLNQVPMRADNRYQYKNCTVAFDAMTGEINFAEIK